MLSVYRGHSEASRRMGKYRAIPWFPMGRLQQRHISQKSAADSRNSLPTILATHPLTSHVVLVDWMECCESGTLPLVSIRITLCGAPRLASRPALPPEISTMLTWQDGVVRSFPMAEGYIGPCPLANEPRALLCVAAVIGPLVSIQSKASVNTRCTMKIKMVTHRMHYKRSILGSGAQNTRSNLSPSLHQIFLHVLTVLHCQQNAGNTTADSALSRCQRKGRCYSCRKS
jgi:hypothetical protein